MDLKGLTIKKFSEGLKKKEFSTEEGVNAFIKTIEEKNSELNAFLKFDLEVHKERALEKAKELDKTIAAGKPVGKLAGVGLGIKDVILIEGTRATASSKILEKYVASYDATVIRKLKDADALFLGKTNLDEFAMGSSTENSAFGVTKNPYDTNLVAGGSSGGSAAAVASDMVLGALGSDTGGSIRQPAAFCGVVGLKPTYGAVSRYGLMAMASSLDQIGPFGKTVEDAAILFSKIAGNDPYDATSYAIDYKNITEPDFKEIKNLTIGVPDEYFVEGLEKEVGDEIHRVIEELKSQGFKFKKISLPHTKYALSCYYIVQPAEVSTNLSRFDGIRYGTREKAKNLLELYKKDKSEGFGPESKHRIILGTFVLSSGYYDAYYNKAQRVRALIKQDFDEAFKDVDVVLTPVTPTLPFKIGEKTMDPLQMYLSDIFTVPANLAGIPGISIPVKGRVGKLPVGFQLMAPRWREADILGIGMYYERN